MGSHLDTDVRSANIPRLWAPIDGRRRSVLAEAVTSPSLLPWTQRSPHLALSTLKPTAEFVLSSARKERRFPIPIVPSKAAELASTANVPERTPTAPPPGIKRRPISEQNTNNSLASTPPEAFRCFDRPTLFLTQYSLVYFFLRSFESNFKMK